MNRSNELREKLVSIFSKRENHDKLIEIDGEKYIYISATNEIRWLHKQPSGGVLLLVGCFTFGKFMWC